MRICQPYGDDQSFNPRSHAGSDLNQTVEAGTLRMFQSTLPRGERRVDVQPYPALIGFNPRSHAGSD